MLDSRLVLHIPAQPGTAVAASTWDILGLGLGVWVQGLRFRVQGVKGPACLRRSFLNSWLVVPFMT